MGMPRPEYFVRSIKDTGALEVGLTSELPAMLGPHPIEDVMHLGSWIQLYTILNSGAKPERFECFPFYNGRPPELVSGRTYPLVGMESGHLGTVCLSPDGRGSAVRITTSNDCGVSWEAHPLIDAEGWFERIRDMEMMVAPLVFRHHAAFRDLDRPGASPLVAVSFCTPPPAPCDVSRYPVELSNPAPNEQQFLSTQGAYMLAKSRADIRCVGFGEAHEALLPIGTFMLVETSAVQQFGIGSPKHWIRGSLRYPDNSLEEGGHTEEDAQIRIYLTIRIRTRPGFEDEVRVVYAAPESCRVLAEMRIAEAEYSTEAARHTIRVQGGAIVAALA